jgi:hypothetical protein
VLRRPHWHIEPSRKSPLLPELLSLFHIPYYQTTSPYLPERFIFDQFFIATLSIDWRMNRKVKDVTNAASKQKRLWPHNRAK